MPQRVASTPSAVATWVLPRPVGPWKTRSSTRPTKSSESISSQPQPSGNRTWDQSRPSPALGTGIPARLSSPARFERSRDSSSRASIDEHAENWRGGGVDAAGGPEGADRPLHGRRLPRLDAASRGARRSARRFAGSSESRKETPVRRRPPHRAVAPPVRAVAQQLRLQERVGRVGGRVAPLAPVGRQGLAAGPDDRGVEDAHRGGGLAGGYPRARRVPVLGAAIERALLVALARDPRHAREGRRRQRQERRAVAP